MQGEGDGYVARSLVIAYTTYIHDGRVKRHAEALARREDHVDDSSTKALHGLILHANSEGFSAVTRSPKLMA